LHDVLGHHLTALAIHLEVAGRSQDTDLRGAVEQARGFVGRMLQDVRATVQDVGAESVDLAGAIRSMVSSLSGPAIELALPEKLRLGANHAQAAFRVVQEAITNTLRHANAKHVRVSARQDEEAVEVQVEDDGRGVEGVPEGNGLRGMRQRIEGLGGTLSIKSSGVMGTQVRVRIPTQRYP
jgi:signal transduction histidine kinase